MQWDPSIHVARHGEHGQTILLVVASIFALLAMMALAIDVSTMYVHKNEAQQTVDAAALAGAKAFVTSGYTSTSGISTTAAQAQAIAAGQQNSVAGSPVKAAELTVTFPQTTQGNPIISVVFTRTAVPTFFARIFGVQGTTVKATAQAEAYNPSGGPAPIQVAGVKPWLVPNCPPSASSGPNACTTNYFIDPTTGIIANTSLVGTQMTLELPSPSQMPPSGTGQLTVVFPTQVQFYALDIPENPPTPFCPSSSQAGCGGASGAYHDGIACFNPTIFTCGQSVNGPSDSVWVDSRVNRHSIHNRSVAGTECLIHASGQFTGKGQDKIPSGTVPVLIQPGFNNPNPALANAQNISRSDSVVTVPLFDGRNLCFGGNCSQVNSATVVGFLQVGIQSVNNANGGNNIVTDMPATIMNVSGCNPSPSASAVSGGNVSAVPVRLIGP